MSDEKKFNDLTADEGVELSDELLDSIAGGLVYHDPGDPAAHRKEAYYVLDASGEIIMRVDNVGRAKHWADNLRTGTRMIDHDEFERLRKGL